VLLLGCGLRLRSCEERVWECVCYGNRLMTVPVVSACVSKGIMELEDLVSYSYLKATIGSTRDARRAGRNAAISAMATKEMVAPMNSKMSVGLMP